MSALDEYDVVLLDDPGGQQRLIWRHLDGPAHEALFEAGSMQKVGHEFVTNWRSAGLPL